jgi:hypothetical protein
MEVVALVGGFIVSAAAACAVSKAALSGLFAAIRRPKPHQ